MTPTAAKPWRTDPAGVRLLVRASPGSGVEAVERVVETAQGPALAVRVRAVAHKGQANRAIEMAVAAWLGLPKSSVAVTAGGKSRLKTLVVAGDSTILIPLLKKLVAGLL